MTGDVLDRERARFVTDRLKDLVAAAVTTDVAGMNTVLARVTGVYGRQGVYLLLVGLAELIWDNKPHAVGDPDALMPDPDRYAVNDCSDPGSVTTVDAATLREDFVLASQWLLLHHDDDPRPRVDMFDQVCATPEMASRLVSALVSALTTCLMERFGLGTA